MTKKKKLSSPEPLDETSRTDDQVVTWIDHTLPVNLTEIAEAQENSDELILDTDLDAEADEETGPDNEAGLQSDADLEAASEELTEIVAESTEGSESLEAQLDRLTKALSARQEETGFERPENWKSGDLLSTQIAEAEELEKIQSNLLLSELGEATEALSALPGEPIVESVPETLDQSELQSSVEALLFLADKPISVEKLHQLLGPDYDLSIFEAGMKQLQERYAGSHHGIELVEVAGGYQFRTKPGRATLAKKLVKVQTQRLSGGGLETLAIVAYRQPVMREDIDQVRGVDSSYFIRNLLDRKLIKISGRSELPGRPMLYETTQEFLEIFGLKDLSALPSLRELEQMIPASQAGRADEEDPRIREMRRMVGQMHADRESILHYNPTEDEKILQEIRDRVKEIPTSTPYLDELKNAEVLARQQALQPADPVQQEAPVGATQE
ncbi:MAG: SMC-Scp complex subunit ScpB [Bdellovibrio sp.]|nr:SMC-Scp complex subunit ScpB [Bdellovibrio sp.]